MNTAAPPTVGQQHGRAGQLDGAGGAVEQAGADREPRAMKRMCRAFSPRLSCVVSLRMLLPVKCLPNRHAPRRVERTGGRTNCVIQCVMIMPARQQRRRQQR